MKKLLYQSSLGIQFNKEVSKGQCTVKVQTKTGKRAYTLRRYTYPNVKLSVASPFLSWETPDFCFNEKDLLIEKDVCRQSYEEAEKSSGGYLEN